MFNGVCFQYSKILKADTIKHVDMKEKMKKNTSGEQENNLKLNYIEIASKE